MTMPATEDGAIHRGLALRRRELLVVYVMMITASRSPLWVCQSPHHHYRGPLLRDAGERVGSSDRVLHPRVDGAPERNRHQVVLRGGPEGTGIPWEAWIGPLF